jgi:hypothetical protein
MTPDFGVLPPPKLGWQWCAGHGIAIQVPASWDLVAQQGQRQDGAWRFADDQRPALQLTWSSRRGDPTKTLRTATRTIGQSNGMTIRHQEACGENGILAEMMHPDHPEQRLHVAVTQLGAVWVVWRQITPGSRDEFLHSIQTAQAFDVATTVPWRLYQMGLDLRGSWRLQGIRHGAGSLRAVWFAYENPKKSTEVSGTLTLRRWARADYLLQMTSNDLTMWVRTNLPKDERFERMEWDAQAGVVHGRTWRRRDGWLNRWRDRRDPVDWLAFVDEDKDRLHVIECIGDASLDLSAENFRKDADPSRGSVDG